MKKLFFLIILIFSSKYIFSDDKCTNHTSEIQGWGDSMEVRKKCCDFKNPLPDNTYRFSNRRLNQWESCSIYECKNDSQCKNGCCVNGRCIIQKCPDGSCSCYMTCTIHQECDTNHCCDATTGKCAKPRCPDGTCNCYLTKPCNSDSDCGPNACCNLKAITTDKQTCQPKCKDGSCSCWKFKNLGEVCYTNFDCDTNQHHYCGDMKLDKTKGTLAGICKKD